MLSHLGSIQFLGDLSLEDADVLAQWAKQSRCILEFGSGGSTQIISQCGADSIVSVETDPTWVETTQSRLNKLTNATPVVFKSYTTQFDQTYDMIFVDGRWHERFDFATAAWSHLRTGGVMLFHDTRRDFDFEIAMKTAQRHFLEIERIDVNARASNGRSSNITVLHKKPYEPYVNWNETEGKPLWAYGVPDGVDRPLWSQHD